MRSMTGLEEDGCRHGEGGRGGLLIGLLRGCACVCAQSLRYTEDTTRVKKSVTPLLPSFVCSLPSVVYLLLYTPNEHFFREIHAQFPPILM